MGFLVGALALGACTGEGVERQSECGDASPEYSRDASPVDERDASPLEEEDASDAGAFCAPGDAGATITCGAVVCDPAQQYCIATANGDTCAPLPFACCSDDTCACVLAHTVPDHGYAFGTCGDNAGAVDGGEAPGVHVVYVGGPPLGAMP